MSIEYHVVPDNLLCEVLYFSSRALSVRKKEVGCPGHDSLISERVPAPFVQLWSWWGERGQPNTKNTNAQQMQEYKITKNIQKESACSVCPTQITKARKKRSKKRNWRVTIFLLHRQKTMESKRLIRRTVTVLPLHNNCASSIAYYCKDNQSAPTLYPNIRFLWGPEFRRCTDNSHLIRKIVLEWPEMIFTVGICQTSLWNSSKNKYELSARPRPKTPINPKHLCWKWCIM